MRQIDTALSSVTMPALQWGGAPGRWCRVLPHAMVERAGPGSTGAENVGMLGKAGRSLSISGLPERPSGVRSHPMRHEEGL